MSTDPWSLLEQARIVLAVHAHPDDESLATGALLATLARSGTRVVLVTATRGEEGEVVPGSIPEGDGRPLDQIRAQEIDGACAQLGIESRHMLGTPPALAGGEARRGRGPLGSAPLWGAPGSHRPFGDQPRTYPYP